MLTRYRERYVLGKEIIWMLTSDTSLSDSMPVSIDLPWAIWSHPRLPFSSNAIEAFGIIDSTIINARSVPLESSPELVLIAGGISSGKSTLYKELLSTRQLPDTFAFHDPDVIMERLPEFQQLRAQKQTHAWAELQKEAYAISIQGLQIAAGSRFNIVATRTLGVPGFVELVEELIELRRYSLTLHYIDTPVELAIKRAQERQLSDFRVIPEKIIRERNELTCEMLPRLVDHASQFIEWIGTPDGIMRRHSN